MKYEPVTVEKIVLERTMEYRDTPVLHYRIEYPQFYREESQGRLDRINEWYRKQARELQRKYETELYREAVDLYENSVANQFPFHMYDAVSTYEVTYNQNGVLSLYHDDYLYSGGAHGNTVRRSETWNSKTGGRIYLFQYACDPAAFRKEIIERIKAQIALQMEEGTGMYFDDYPKLVAENFNAENFYLTPEGLVIYYQQYDIAPYASGIPEFLINS